MKRDSDIALQMRIEANVKRREKCQRNFEARYIVSRTLKDKEVEFIIETKPPVKLGGRGSRVFVSRRFTPTKQGSTTPEIRPRWLEFIYTRGKEFGVIGWRDRLGSS